MNNKFIEKFHIRWSDIDANKHLGNSSYMDYCNQTRISFMKSIGYNISKLEKLGITTVALKENYIFYREIYADQTVFVTLELTKISEDGNISELVHKIYDENGIHHATCLFQSTWIDFIKRKRTPPPVDIKNGLLKISSENLKIFTIEDIKNSEKPVNLSSDFLKENYYRY